MTITPSKLRENLYNLLDQVLESGEPLDINRKGRILHIIPEKKVSKLEKIKAKKITKASDEELINSSWEGEWKPFI
ncbi:MAG: type II toxin-antitoxin system Phd/YefM family antitoxin [Campylobacterota bacterium]|nr:type II toxin-antitoxin system Phd/YefM family antitoxin [Campylobacterota bacterium]